MTENEAWLVTGTTLLHGKYRDEVVVRNGRLWVWFKSDSGNEWTLQCPSQIVVDEEQ
ncbi:hypothetical protein SEA_PARADIDDLES_145 [Streptomyces phage Paradiddles]|uniref:Uncharacterized protein n=1 Tax=Streptomyces phage Paradiddles TaxID=2023993 RepID=A0A222Z0C7_9CAUD|nr:hypothetical protein FDI37_gp125 [Streptomyces phage Paradiddles]UGL63129.1 hypothetical protein SEA_BARTHOLOMUNE_149 [Streptomyces phage Bartholomune]UOW93561.1 hypothetical protein SEA_SQUILLIUM_149 [Streptomyces phage Squillium]WNM73393.1 hypothetical protein SEA_LIANDRY_149 [Streptomyces phage Liandry]WNM74791.1 hypothetical protein SEA_PINKIEPIE_146 [Streptomyces phage PinkiePie]ASR77603.1 hypothetical protein SEA_PARADIDDLES_145 [Streptomyces phage Paradiddles]